jgi:hypothetical protein
MLLLKLFGLKLLVVSLEFPSRKNHVYGVITLVLLFCQQIQFSMLAPSILRLITCLFENGLLPLDVRFISSKDQIADGFTKTLCNRNLDEFKHNLNLSHVSIKGVLEL